MGSLVDNIKRTVRRGIDDVGNVIGPNPVLDSSRVGIDAFDRATGGKKKKRPAPEDFFGNLDTLLDRITQASGKGLDGRRISKSGAEELRELLGTASSERQRGLKTRDSEFRARSESFRLSSEKVSQAKTLLEELLNPQAGSIEASRQVAEFRERELKDRPGQRQFQVVQSLAGRR